MCDSARAGMHRAFTTNRKEVFLQVSLRKSLSRKPWQQDLPSWRGSLSCHLDAWSRNEESEMSLASSVVLLCSSVLVLQCPSLFSIRLEATDTKLGIQFKHDAERRKTRSSAFILWKKSSEQTMGVKFEVGQSVHHACNLLPTCFIGKVLLETGGGWALSTRWAG